MGRGKKRSGNGDVRIRSARADSPARVSTASVLEPREPARQEIPLLPPVVEQWLRRQGTALGICLFLIAATLAVYGQTVGFEFVSYDDNDYVYENHHVREGFSPASLKWAFTGVHSANWHPLTTLSHILDWSLYGKWAGGHHLTNVFLHAAGSVVLFLALRRLTGATWRSGLVAALFALHPLHVESVAWVAERKDVLSGLFFALTLWAYAAYALQKFSWSRYLLVVVLFALGLLSKPMLVTLPFLLFLLDFWPLERWGASRLGILVLEKLPLLALSAASCMATYLVQRSVGAVMETVSPIIRAQTIVLGYARYLAAFVWPFNLAVPYPRDREIYTLATVGCGLALAIVSIAALLCCRKRYRYLLVGWFWFAGMLVPVIGVVVVGHQSVADRYSYLTYTGLFIALVWGAAELLEAFGKQSRRVSLSHEGTALVAGSSTDGPSSSFDPSEKVGRTAANWSFVVAGLVLVFCAIRSFQQTRIWHDSLTLYTHGLEVTKENSVLHTNYGRLLLDQHQRFEAEIQFREALRIDHENPLAHNDLGLVQREKGDLRGAAQEYLAALTFNPNLAMAHSNLAVVYGSLGRMADAEQESREALRIDPDCAPAENNLAIALAGQGRFQDAVPHYRRAIDFDPDDAKAHKELGVALFAIGSVEEGVAECRRSIELDPEDASSHHELAKIYHSLNRLREAFDEWKEVLSRQPANAAAAKGLGMVLVKAGHGADAIPYIQIALAAAPNDLDARRCKIFAHLGAKQLPEAMAEFRAVLHQDPKDQHVLKGLIQTLAATPNDLCVREMKAYVHLDLKQSREAMAEFREMLQQDPNNATALNALACMEATHPDAKLRNGKEAVELAEKAAALTKGTQPTVLDTQAAAYAEVGRFQDAVATAQKAKQAAEKSKNQTLADGIAVRLKSYEGGKPYRDATLGD
jgi:protein O-mannosyl-transferase